MTFRKWMVWVLLLSIPLSLAGWVGQKIGGKAGFLFVSKEMPLSWYLHVLQFYITQILYLVILIGVIWRTFGAKSILVVVGMMISVVLQLFVFIGYRNDFPVYVIYPIPIVFLLTYFKRGY